MKRIGIFKRFLVIALIILSLGMFFSGSIFTAMSYAASSPANPDNPTYTVSFKVNGYLYKTYKLNPGQTIDKPMDPAIASYSWKTSGGTDFNFASTMGNSPLTLNLNIPDASKCAVIFYQKNPNYNASYPADEYYSEYMGIDIKIVTIGGTVEAYPTASVPASTGFECTGWLAGGPTAPNTFDFTNSITGTIMMYPKFERIKYDLTFKHWDNSTEVFQVEHGVLFNSIPTGKTQPSKTFGYWYLESDGTKSQVDFNRTTFTGDTTFLAYYYDQTYDVTLETSSIYGTMSGPAFAERGATYTCTITLNSKYDQFALTRNNIIRTGTIGSITVTATATKGVYTCELVQVSSAITLSFNTNIVKNRYNVSFDFTNAKGVSVVPLDAYTTYTMSGSDYSVEYDDTFYFALELDSRYEAAQDDINTPAGVGDGISSEGYFADLNNASVKWSTRFECYQIVATEGDSDISVSVNTAECITVVFTGIENLNVTIGNPSFVTSLVKWDDVNNIARIRKNTRHTFTAVSSDVDRYFVAGFSGVTQSANQNEYVIYSATDFEASFTVIETVYMIVPATLPGATNISYDTSIAAGGGTYNNFTGNYEWKTPYGGDFYIYFTFATEYTEAVPVVTLSQTGSATVDMSEFAAEKKIIIRNVTSECTIAYSALEKNKYTINLISNDMADLECMDGFTNTVYYGANLEVKVTKTLAYSNAEINTSNIATTATKYAGLALEDVEDEDYYILTISTVVGSFTASVADLVKNSYKVSLISNEYAELTTANDYAQYNGRFVCSYSLGASYNTSTLSPTNVKVQDSLTGEFITTYTVTRDLANRTITVDNIITEITIYIDGLTKNSYDVLASYFASVSGVTVDKIIDSKAIHGSSYTFSLAFNDPAYTQSIEKIEAGEQNLQYNVNGGDYVTLTPTRMDNVLTYSIYNISGNITFRMDALNTNKYTVIFYDTDPVAEIYRYNAVTHGTAIMEPTKPTKEGYQCIGWYLGETSPTQVTNFNSISDNMTLYARYNSQTFTVTFIDYNNVTTNIDRETVQTVSYGKPVTWITPANKPGYSKSYWDTEGKNLNSVKTNYTVYAVYEIDVYTVTFYNGTIVHDVQEVEYNSKAHRPSTDPYKQGYEFDSWDFNYVSTAITEDTNIYAQFNILSYKIEFRNVTQGNLIVSYFEEYNSTVLEPYQFTGNDGKVVRGKYVYPTRNSDGTINASQTNQLNNGYVLEGWYADAGMSIRYNFDNPIKGDTIIYGNMYISKVSVKFHVNGNFYLEKLVDFNNTLVDIPTVPLKEGYTQKTAVWTTRNLEGVDTSSYNENNVQELTNEFSASIVNLQNDLDVYSFYRINTYKVTFKLPDGASFVRDVYHGGTITNIPYPDTSFGEVIVIDRTLYQYVTQDTVVYITVIDFLPFLMVAGASCLLAFVIISLVVAIKNMRRGIRNIKNMENLFKAIKKQDLRITQMNEEKLKAQVEAQMREKEKYKRNNFLDN